MKCLCFGTFAKILVLCKGTVSQKILVGSILLSVNRSYDITTNDNAVSNLLSCRDNISPSITDLIPKIDKDSVVNHFEDSIIKMLHPDKLKLAVLAIVDFLKQDSIDDETIVEPINQIQKKTLCEQKEFVFLDLIAGLFLYTLNVSNKNGASCVGDITDDYVAGFMDRKNEIKLINAYMNKSNADRRTNTQKGDNNIMFTGDITGGTFNFNLPGDKK